MVVAQMVQNGYEPGKGKELWILSVQWVIKIHSVWVSIQLDLIGAKDCKRNAWNLSKPIPHIAQSFIKSQGEPCPELSIPSDVDEMCQGIKEMFYEVNMTQRGDGTSHMDVQFISPNVQLNNLKATPLPTKKESW